jgi:hypothetical protein
MSQPTPTIGSTNVRGYVLPDTCQGNVEALPSIYGFQRADVKNPNCFYVVGGVDFPEGAEIFFDVIAAPWGRGEAVAANLRIA